MKCEAHMQKENGPLLAGRSVSPERDQNTSFPLNRGKTTLLKIEPNV